MPLDSTGLRFPAHLPYCRHLGRCLTFLDLLTVLNSWLGASPLYRHLLFGRVPPTSDSSW
jgi:hypothetical protein